MWSKKLSFPPLTVLYCEGMLIVKSRFTHPFQSPSWSLWVAVHVCVLEVGQGREDTENKAEAPAQFPGHRWCGVTVWPLHGFDGGSPSCLW